ncbi:MAG: O-antigen ligase family protein [Chloroflexi bacterium]|nr:O-antigen ligase family protein [Chloroflexota bacterium]MCC6895134.1 O-antigen ligase family protein [Anaerolineae bacterium]
MLASVLQRFSFIGWLRFWLLDRNYNKAVPAMLVGLCLILTVISTLLLRDFDPTSFGSIVKAFLPILALGGLTVAMLMYRYLEATALVILFVSTLINDGVSTGTDTKLTFTFLALLLWSVIWLFRKVIVERSFNLRPSTANWPILFFCIVVLISYVWSGAFPEKEASYMIAQKSMVRLMTALILIVSPLTYVLFSNLMRSPLSFKIIVWWFIAFGLVTAVMRLVLGYVIPPLNVRGQLPTWVCALALGQVLFNKNLAWYIRLGLLIPIGLWCQISLGLGISWLSGWVPIVAVMGVLITLYSRKLLIVGLVLVAVWGALNFDFVSETFAGEQDESGGTRSTAWARTFGVVEKHLLFGAGPAGYEYYFHAYGYYDVGVGLADLSHNNYIDIIAQTGVIGFVIWIWMWIGQGWMMWKLFNKRIEDPFYSALRYSLVACYPAILVCMMLGDWITPFPYTQGLGGIDYTIWSWMLSGLAIALYYFTPPKKPAGQLVDLASSPTLADGSAS